MEQVTYVLIPGLWDQKPLFGWFYRLVARWWTFHGLQTVICDMKWVSTESYEEKHQRLEGCIEKLQKQGRGVVLVGVSAGGPMTIIGLAEYRSVIAAVSISGLLALSQEDRKNPLLSSASWFVAADRAEQALRRLSAKRRRRILTLSGVKDDLIDPRQEHVLGGQSKRVIGKSHLPTVVRIMLWYPHTIRRFVEGLH